MSTGLDPNEQPCVVGLPAMMMMMAGVCVPGIGRPDLFGSLEPVAPSDDGEVSHGRSTGSPTAESSWEGKEGTPRETLLGASTSLSSVEAGEDEDDMAGGFADSSMAVAKLLIDSEDLLCYQ